MKISYCVNEHLLQVFRPSWLYKSMHLKAATLFLWISAWHASQRIGHEARPEAGTTWGNRVFRELEDVGYLTVQYLGVSSWCPISPISQEFKLKVLTNAYKISIWVKISNNALILDMKWFTTIHHDSPRLTHLTNRMFLVQRRKELPWWVSCAGARPWPKPTSPAARQDFNCPPPRILWKSVWALRLVTTKYDKILRSFTHLEFRIDNTNMTEIPKS